MPTPCSLHPVAKIGLSIAAVGIVAVQGGHRTVSLSVDDINGHVVTVSSTKPLLQRARRHTKSHIADKPGFFDFTTTINLESEREVKVVSLSDLHLGRQPEVYLEGQKDIFRRRRRADVIGRIEWDLEYRFSDFPAKVPEGDILICAGDMIDYDVLSNRATEAAENIETLNPYAVFMDWFEMLVKEKNFKMGIIIAGNHDTWLDRNYRWYNSDGKKQNGYGDQTREWQHTKAKNAVNRARNQNIFYLEKQLLKVNLQVNNSPTDRFEPLRIYGDPQCYNLPDKAGAFSPYNADSRQIRHPNYFYEGKRWRYLPVDSYGRKLDILVTHGPPLGVLDKNYKGVQETGSAETMKLVKLARPSLHVFGHEHTGMGVENDGKFTPCPAKTKKTVTREECPGTTFMLAAVFQKYEGDVEFNAQLFECPLTR